MFALGHRQQAPWLLLGGLGLVWAIVIYQLSAQWSVYSEYHYGWGVPILMAYLFWERWKTRPAPVSRPSSPAWAALAAVSFVFWPTRLLHEANPIWRLTSWALGLEVIALALIVLWL